MAKDKIKMKLTNRSVSSLSPKEKLYRVWDESVSNFCIKVRPSGAKVFCLFYRHNGRLKEYTLGKFGGLTVEQAKKEATVLSGKVAQGNDVQENKKNAREKAKNDRLKTLGLFIEHKYEPWVLSAHKQGEHTLYILKLHFSFLYDYPLNEITEWIIVKWRTERLRKGISKKTVNRDIMTLKGLLSRAVDWGVIEFNPINKVKPLKVDNMEKKRFLSTEEEKTLRSALSDRDKAIRRSRMSANEWRGNRGYAVMGEYKADSYPDHITPIVLLLLNTGMRPRELLQLEWMDVSFERKTLTVKGENAKSGKTRYIPLNIEAEAILQKCKKGSSGSQFVFPSPVSDQPMDKMPRAITRLIKDIPLKDFRPYDLRHTFASKLAMAGVDLNTIRELLGHQDMTMTLIYAHLAPEHKASAVALLVNG